MGSIKGKKVYDLATLCADWTAKETGGGGKRTDLHSRAIDADSEEATENFRAMTWEATIAAWADSNKRKRSK